MATSDSGDACPATSAFVWGLAHFRSVDGRHFDFSGRCEYTLLHTFCSNKPHTIVQAQFGPWPAANSAVTGVTAVAVQENGGDVVRVEAVGETPALLAAAANPAGAALFLGVEVEHDLTAHSGRLVHVLADIGKIEDAVELGPRLLVDAIALVEDKLVGDGVGADFREHFFGDFPLGLPRGI